MSVALPLMQRASGRGALALSLKAGRTRLDRLHQEGSAKIRLPASHGHSEAEAVFINTSGGMTGGDTLDWSVDLGPDTSLVATSQACEKAYRASRGAPPARMDVRLEVGSGAQLAWLPQETILYEGCRLTRRIEADLAPGARLLMSEAIVLGREAMGETLADVALRDTWRIRAGGRLIHAEEMRLDATALGRQSPALLGEARGFATILLVCNDADTLAPALRARLAGLEGLDVGVSGIVLGGVGKLVARLLGRNGLCLRRGLIAAIEMLNKEAGLPKVWRL